jgi:hypothetical protein
MKSKTSELERELDAVKRQLSEEQEKVRSAREKAIAEIKELNKDEKEKKKKQEETKVNKAAVMSELKSEPKKLRSPTPTPDGGSPPASPATPHPAHDPEFSSPRDKTKKSSTPKKREVLSSTSTGFYE